MADAFLGEIRMFGGTFAPLHWAFCDGQIFDISQNEALFSLLGNRFGGDGTTTFGLPNLVGRVPVHAYPEQDMVLGQVGGVEHVTLTGDQLAAHTHTMQRNTAAGNEKQPGGNVLARAPLDIYVQPPTLNSPIAANISPAGGSQPHDNVQPFQCVSFIIALEGTWPARS